MVRCFGGSVVRCFGGSVVRCFGGSVGRHRYCLALGAPACLEWVLCSLSNLDARRGRQKVRWRSTASATLTRGRSQWNSPFTCTKLLAASLRTNGSKWRARCAGPRSPFLPTCGGTRVRSQEAISQPRTDRDRFSRRVRHVHRTLRTPWLRRCRDDHTVGWRTESNEPIAPRRVTQHPPPARSAGPRRAGSARWRLVVTLNRSTDQPSSGDHQSEAVIATYEVTEGLRLSA